MQSVIDDPKPCNQRTPSTSRDADEETGSGGPGRHGMASTNRASVDGAPKKRTVRQMYLLIEPEQFPVDLRELAGLAAVAASKASGLPLGSEGEVDGPLDPGDHEVAQAVDYLLNAVYSGKTVPPELTKFLRAVLEHLG